MISLDQQIKEVQREIAMRKSVFPQLVARNKMTFGEATSRIDAMQDVLRTLTNVKEGKPWDA